MRDSWIQNNALRIKPLSVRALLLTILLLLFAVGIRELFSYFGATLYFATFFPAVLIASLFAGAPAGILCIFMSVVIAWWAILPPVLEFGSLSSTDYANFAVFSCSAGLIVWLC